MNFDQQSGDRRSWKGVQVDYDTIFSMSDRKCSYCLTEQQVTAILGIVDTFAWHTRWFSDSTEIDRQKIADFAADLERNLMGGCCDDNMPIQYRYSSTGELEWSLNGGQNWTPAPQYDPRVYSPTFPPMTGDDGSDKKCIAATGAALLVKEQVGDQLTDDMSRYTLGQLITDWVKTMLQTSNPFEALLTVITNQIFALVIATLRPALTDTVYDTFKCILYCRMAEDASFNTAQWQDVRSDITDQIGGIAGLFLEHLVYLLGEKGLTNLARSGAATEGDCSECTECAELRLWQWDLTTDPVEIFPDELGVWTAVSNAPFSGFYNIAIIASAVYTEDFTPCFQDISVMSETGLENFTSQQRCNDGVYDPLAHCLYSFLKRGLGPCSFTFTVAGACTS